MYLPSLYSGNSTFYMVFLLSRWRTFHIYLVWIPYLLITIGNSISAMAMRSSFPMKTQRTRYRPQVGRSFGASAESCLAEPKLFLAEDVEEDIEAYVWSYLVCQQDKIDRRKEARLLEPLPFPV